MEKWAWEMVATYGLAGVVLAAVGLALWRVLVWLAAFVVRPLVAAHIGHLKAMSTTMEQIAGTQAKMLPLIEKIHENTKGESK